MGTVLLTGANSSLGLPAVEHLLTQYPSHTAILTVRNLSPDDLNTAKLRAIVAKYPNAKATIRKLDLSSLAEVRTFAIQFQEQVVKGEIPRLVAIVCNAMTWSLADGAKYSMDGLELSMAVNHLSHLSLVLRLLESVDTQNGRIIFLSSDTHYPKKAAFEVYPPAIPQDLDEWVHPKEDHTGEEAGKGFYRYGVSKLAVVMGMYALDRRLKRTKGLENIRTLAIDPGGLLDSRAFAQSDVPVSWKVMISVANRLQPLLRFLNPNLNRSGSAAKDVIDMAVSEELKGMEGHFIRRVETLSSPDSRIEGEQERVWRWSLELCGLGEADTVLSL